MEYNCGPWLPAQGTGGGSGLVVPSWAWPTPSSPAGPCTLPGPEGLWARSQAGPLKGDLPTLCFLTGGPREEGGRGQEGTALLHPQVQAWWVTQVLLN